MEDHLSSAKLSNIFANQPVLSLHFLVKLSTGHRSENVDPWHGDFVVDDKVVGRIKSGVLIRVHSNNHLGGNINTKLPHPSDLFLVLAGMVEVFTYGHQAILIGGLHAYRQQPATTAVGQFQHFRPVCDLNAALAHPNDFLRNERCPQLRRIVPVHADVVINKNDIPAARPLGFPDIPDDLIYRAFAVPPAKKGLDGAKTARKRASPGSLNRPPHPQFTGIHHVVTGQWQGVDIWCTLHPVDGLQPVGFKIGNNLWPDFLCFAYHQCIGVLQRPFLFAQACRNSSNHHRHLFFPKLIRNLVSPRQTGAHTCQADQVPA